MTLRSQIKALDELQKSRGWQTVQRIMEQEVVAAAMMIADDPNMTAKEIDFRRGAIWAARQLLNLPDRLKARLETDLALSHEDDSQDAR
jgi:hypothetical protein